MPDTSTILSLPLILPAQAQKHVTHNEALRLLDIIVQLAVKDRTLASPPAAVAGDRYIVPTGATGVWAGHGGKIALFENGSWQFVTPLAGWQAWVADEAATAAFDGTAWVTLAEQPLSISQLGVSATADATNRLAVSSPATLLNNAGAGHQLKVNKAAAADTASLLFQSGFSGRAEMGTMGSDDFGIKVSPDGSSFFTALTVARADGQITLPAALRLGGQASDPVSPPNGAIWLNTTTSEVKVRSNGVSVVVATAAGGVGDGDKGDLTVSGSGAVWTVDAGVVSNAKLANVATATIKGRLTAGSGAPEDLTAAQATGLLDIVTSGAKGLAPASGGGTANFLRADGSWAAPAAGGATNLGYDAATRVVSSDSGTDATLPLVDGTNAGLMAPANFTKLASIASGATANSADATLLARANHTGSQAAATITGLAAVATSGSAADLTAGVLPAARFDDTAHGTRAGGTLHAAVVAAGAAGFMLGSDKTKLDGIAAGAQVNVGTDFAYTPATRVLESSTGADVTLPLVTTADPGMAPASGGGTTNFLRADGTWAAPSGGGGGVSDGAKGDVIVSDGGTVWTLDPAVRYGLPIALQQNIFFN